MLINKLKRLPIYFYYKILPAFFKIAPNFFLSIFVRIVDIDRPRYGWLRSVLLEKHLIFASKVMNLLNFNQNIILNRNKDIFVESDGILLNSRFTKRYLKVNGKRKSGNQGAEIHKVLNFYGISLQKMVDLGANFG